MNGKMTMALALSLLGVGSCDGRDVPLCTGSDGLELRVFYQGGGQDATGGTVRIENGYSSFAVDGQCQYFISGGWQGVSGRDQGWRRGRVGDGLRATLERLAGEADLAGIDDCDRYSLVFDAPSLVIANVRSSVTTCGRPGARLTAVSDAIRERAPELWERGQPLDGDLHIVVLEGPALVDTWPPYAWPSGLAIADYFDREQEALGQYPPGSSRRVVASDAAPLRVLREQFLSDVRARPTLAPINGIPVTDGAFVGWMFLRDALPYENERGLWPLPNE